MIYEALSSGHSEELARVGVRAAQVDPKKIEIEMYTYVYVYGAQTCRLGSLVRLGCVVAEFKGASV